MATRIEIPQFDMYYQIVVDQKEGYIELNEQYAFINQQYLCKIPKDEDDEAQVKSREGWVDTAIHQRINYKRKDISLIALDYQDEHRGYEIWAVKTYICGNDYPATCYFKKKKDAESAFDIISLWWLSY